MAFTCLGALSHNRANIPWFGTCVIIILIAVPGEVNVSETSVLIASGSYFIYLLATQIILRCIGLPPHRCINSLNTRTHADYRQQLRLEFDARMMEIIRETLVDQLVEVYSGKFETQLFPSEDIVTGRKLNLSADEFASPLFTDAISKLKGSLKVQPVQPVTPKVLLEAVVEISEAQNLASQRCQAQGVPACKSWDIPQQGQAPKPSSESTQHRPTAAQESPVSTVEGLNKSPLFVACVSAIALQKAHDEKRRLSRYQLKLLELVGDRLARQIADVHKTAERLAAEWSFSAHTDIHKTKLFKSYEILRELAESHNRCLSVAAMADYEDLHVAAKASFSNKAFNSWSYQQDPRPDRNVERNAQPSINPASRQMHETTSKDFIASYNQEESLQSNAQWQYPKLLSPLCVEPDYETAYCDMLTDMLSTRTTFQRFRNKKGHNTETDIQEWYQVEFSGIQPALESLKYAPLLALLGLSSCAWPIGYYVASRLWELDASSLTRKLELKQVSSVDITILATVLLWISALRPLRKFLLPTLLGWLASSALASDLAVRGLYFATSRNSSDINAPLQNTLRNLAAVGSSLVFVGVHAGLIRFTRIVFSSSTGVTN